MHLKSSGYFEIKKHDFEATHVFTPQEISLSSSPKDEDVELDSLLALLLLLALLFLQCASVQKCFPQQRHVEEEEKTGKQAKKKVSKQTNKLVKMQTNPPPSCSTFPAVRISSRKTNR